MGAADLLASVAVQSGTVAVLTGFPCVMSATDGVPQETDGPLGAMSIARTLAVLGREVVLITDEINVSVLQAAIDCFAQEGNHGQAFSKHISLESFPPANEWGEAEEERLDELASLVGHIVAVERTGPAADGTYRTMDARDMSSLVAPLERLIVKAAARGVTSTGIADGGNEVGMGKVFE